ncbi:MAG: hypothetical protein ABIN74_05280, partial [Ferruginibacter sp.]
MKKNYLLFIIAFLFVEIAHGQSLAINTDGSAANASALLDIKSNAKGVLVPRMLKTERNAIGSPAPGLLVYQNGPDSVGFYFYNGSSWLWMATAVNAADWGTTGNAGTDTSINFLGTTNNMPLRLKQNSQWLGQFNANNGTFFLGNNSGIENTTAFANVAVGGASLKNNSVASRNTVIGDSAMYTQSFSNGGTAYLMDNTAVGSKALFFNQPTTNANGFKNTAIGSEALYFNTTGQENTAVGTGALHDNTTGSYNTAAGRSAHRLSNYGIQNSYFGYEAGYTDSTGSANTGLGAFALRNNRSSNNVAIGSESMLNNNAVGNTAVGYRSMRTNTTGIQNTAIGFESMHNNNAVSNTA